MRSTRNRPQPDDRVLPATARDRTGEPSSKPEPASATSTIRTSWEARRLNSMLASDGNPAWRTLLVTSSLTSNSAFSATSGSR